MVMFIATVRGANARAGIRAHNHFRGARHRYDGIQPQVNLLNTMPEAHRNIVL